MKIYSEEAEKGVLGSCLISYHGGSKTLPIDVALDAGCTSEWFYVPAHRHLWETIVGMHTGGEALDLLMVGESLKAEGRLEIVGGYEFLENLVDATPTAANIGKYLIVIEEKSVLRRVFDFGCYAQDRASIAGVDVEELLIDLQDQLMGIGGKKKEEKSIEEFGEEFIDDCEKGVVGDVNHFCPQWDEEFGLLSNEIVFVHAPRSTGKTAFVIQWQRRLAKLGTRAPLLSLESLKKTITPRYIAQEARINTLDLKRKRLPAGHPHFKLARQALQKLRELKLVVRDGKFPIENLLAYAVAQKKAGAKAIFIDNLLCLGTTKKFDSRTLMYIYFLEKIRDARNEVDMPFIILAHPNGEGKIAWAGDVENLADIIVFLYNTQKMIDAGKIPDWELESINTAVPEGQIHISAKFQKNRDGETPRKDLSFNPSIQTFEAR